MSYDPFSSRLILLSLDQRHFAPPPSKYSEILNFQSDTFPSFPRSEYRIVSRCISFPCNNSFPFLAVNSVSRGKEDSNLSIPVADVNLGERLRQRVEISWTSEIKTRSLIEIGWKRSRGIVRARFIERVSIDRKNIQIRRIVTWDRTWYGQLPTGEGLN